MRNYPYVNVRHNLLDAFFNSEPMSLPAARNCSYEGARFAKGGERRTAGSREVPFGRVHRNVRSDARRRGGDRCSARIVFRPANGRVHESRAVDQPGSRRRPLACPMDLWGCAGRRRARSYRHFTRTLRKRSEGRRRCARLVPKSTGVGDGPREGRHRAFRIGIYRAHVDLAQHVGVVACCGLCAQHEICVP